MGEYEKFVNQNLNSADPVHAAGAEGVHLKDLRFKGVMPNQPDADEPFEGDPNAAREEGGPSVEDILIAEEEAADVDGDEVSPDEALPVDEDGHFLNVPESHTPGVKERGGKGV